MMDRISRWLAYHLPRRVVYWASIRLMAHATTDEWSGQVAPELYAMDALKRWENSKPGGEEG